MTKRQKNIFIYGFRYALSRQTYAMDDIIEEWEITKHNFENWEIELMVRETGQQINETKYYNGFGKSKDTIVQKLIGFKKTLTEDMAERYD